MLTAEIIEIKNAERKSMDEGGPEEFYSFKAYKFPNGVLLIPGESTADWFFDSENDYEPNGNDINVSIKGTGRHIEFGAEQLADNIAASEREFGAVSDKVKELVTSAAKQW